MKKYITPNIETIEAIYGSALCDQSAGKGVTITPGTPDPEQGGPGGAPQRRLF